MSFLSPLAALAAAAVTIPLLVLLYVLKLRRRYIRVGSTMLWEKAFEDLEVNTPFQRLRWSILLLVQLLILLMLLAAMARPVVESDQRFSGRLVLLLDRSASMQATDANGRTRLEAAKREARAMLDRLPRRELQQVMVIAFARTAHLVSGFQFDRRTLLDAIDAIEPTDEEADLNAALQLAAAFGGEAADTSEESEAPRVDVVLISDGNVGKPPDELGFRLRTGSFRFIRVGPAANRDDDRAGNVGIVSFSARREYDDPTRVLVFSRLISTAPAPIEAVLTLRVNGEPVDVRQVALPAAEWNENGDDGDGDGGGNEAVRPGEASVAMSLELTTGAVLSLRHNVEDILASDNTAWLVMPPPRQPRIALVHPPDGPDPFTVQLLEGLEPGRLDPMTAESFGAIDSRLLDSGEQFDLVVFDRVDAARLPGVPSLTLGGVPAGMDATPPSSEGGRRILSWDRQHPVMRHVALDTIVFRGFGAYQLPSGSTALARGPDGPVIAIVGARGARHVLVGFPLQPNATTWPLHVSVAVFMQNAFEFLTLASTGEVGLVTQPGVPITVRATAEARMLIIEGRETTRQVESEPGTMRTLPTLRRVGLYTVRHATPPMDRIAVSMLSDQESNLHPRDAVLVNAGAAVAGAGGATGTRELWPWLAAVALVLVVTEWLLYCRRAA